jgi:hypothetical protein
MAVKPGIFVCCTGCPAASASNSRNFTHQFPIMTIAQRLFLPVLLLAAAAAPAQDDPKAVLDQIAGKIARNRQSSPQYGLFLHYDKPWYQAGSTIWFRGYLYNLVTRQPAPVKDNLYVELLSSDSLVKQLVLNSAAREWDGGLVIPGRLPEGYYTLRAYTKELVVQGADRIFTQPVFILNEKQKVGGMPAPAAPGEPQLRFYPEGGSLVNGIDNSVAIVATSSEGYPIPVKGRILDDTDKKMADFQTDAHGLALVKFAPYKNRRYKAEIEGPEERTRIFDLPPINYRASVLTVVSQSPTAVRLRVALGDSIYAEKPAAYLLGLSRGQIRFAAMGNGMFEVDVPLDQFAEGSASFLLFNEKQEVKSRRDVFIPIRRAQVKVVADNDNYASRQKANIALRVLDPDGQPLSALLSVSITDDRLVQWGPAAPGWYGPKSEAALVAQGQTGWIMLPYVGPDSILSIRGRLLDRNGSLAAGQVVTLLAEGTSLVLSDTSDADGRFAFDGMEFPDAAPFMAQVNDPAGTKKGVRVVLDDAETPKLPVPPMPSWMTASEALRSFRLQQADSVLIGPTPVMLEEIRVRAPKGKKAKSDEMLKSASSRMITGEQLDKLGLGTTVQAVLMLPGVMKVGDQITIRGGAPGIMTSGNLEPLLIIDGVPSGGGSVSSQLNSINPKLIESIEVVTGGEAARYGARAGNGVIVVKTANMMRDDAAPLNDRGMQYIYPQGYHQRPDFYAPPYDVPGIREATFTDNRSTLFWNGELQTDKTGAAKFSFFTSDLRGTYSLRIVGITAKGDLIDEIIRISRQ